MRADCLALVGSGCAIEISLERARVGAAHRQRDGTIVNLPYAD
jgi:hypothetical protein